MKKIIIGMMVLTSVSAFAGVIEKCGKVTSLRTSGYVNAFAELDSGATLSNLSTEEIALLAAAKIADRQVCAVSIDRSSGRSIELK